MTRSAEQMSTTRVRRDDGVTLELPSYAPLHRLPHDLAHFVIERALGLTCGFWGSIADGAVFGGMAAVPRRQTARVEDRARQVMRGANSRVTEAEAVVGTVVEIYQRRHISVDDVEAIALLVQRALAADGRELPEYGGTHGLAAWRQRAESDREWALVITEGAIVVGVCHGSPCRVESEQVGSEHAVTTFLRPTSAWSRRCCRTAAQAGRWTVGLMDGGLRSE